MFQITGLSTNLPSLINVAEPNKVGIVGGNSNCKDKTVKRSSSKNSNKATNYLSFKPRLAFTKLSKAFTKSLILQLFDPESLIRIEIDVLGYAIGKVLIELTLDNLSQ